MSRFVQIGAGFSAMLYKLYKMKPGGFGCKAMGKNNFSKRQGNCPDGLAPDFNVPAGAAGSAGAAVGAE
jgi:hypothetical protein